MGRLSLIVMLVLALKAFPDASGVLRRGATITEDTPGQIRMQAAVVRRDPKNQLVRRKTPTPSQRPRVALVTKAGATVTGGTTHPTSIAAPVKAGTVFTTRTVRTVSTSTGPTTTPTTAATAASGATTATATTTAGTTATGGTTGTTTTPTTTTSTSTTTTTPTTTTSTSTTTCPTCAISYGNACPYPATNACTEPCCLTGMICSYQSPTTGACFPPTG